MNTIRSTWVGMGVLCAAGGGAYYFAKKSINADRQTRYENDLRRKTQLAAQEAEHRRQTSQATHPANPSEDPSLKRARQSQSQPQSQQSPRDDTASPSTEAARDPAPTRHEPITEAERMLEKGKYETAEPYRPPKGNRFT